MVRGAVSGGGGELVNLAGRVNAELGEQVAGGLGQFGTLPEGAGGPGEGAQVDAVKLAADVARLRIPRMSTNVLAPI